MALRSALFVLLAITLIGGTWSVELDAIPSVKVSTTTTTATTTITNTTTTERPSKPKSQRQLLRDHLLKDHDVQVHPVLDHNDKVVVEVGMAVIHVSMSVVKSTMSVDAWMRFKWKNEHLMWNPDEFEGLRQIHFANNEIWRPDILVYNNARPSTESPYGNAHYVVESDGSVLWVPPAHLEGFCKVNLRHWPLDTQTCKLKFGSWTSHGNQIDLELYQNTTHVEMLNFYTNHNEWDIVDTFVSKRSVSYQCCPNQTYPDITFAFDLQRNSPSYRALLILPCLVIMLMTTCCFLLPPMAGEKVTANGFAFLASVLFLLYFATTLPFHAKDVPILVMFFSNTTAMIGIGLLLNVSCISMSRERKYQGPPKFLKNIFAGTLGRCLCLGNYYHQVSSTHQRLVLELSDLPSDSASAECGADDDDEMGAGSGGGANNSVNRSPRCNSDRNSEQSGVMKDWMLVAAGLERFFFVIYFVAFAVVTSVYV